MSKAKAAANRAKSRIRARIEHVFGAQETAPGGRLVRTIGIVLFAGWRRSNAGGLTLRSTWRADWSPLDGGVARRRSEAVPLRKSAQRRPLIFDEIRHQFELSR